MSNILTVLHPKHIDEYFTLTDYGNVFHFRFKEVEPIRNYGNIASILTYSHVEKVINIYGQEELSEDKDVTYTGEYLSELLWPWLSVFQKYGTNGFVCNLETGEIQLFQRENYNTNVSCFATGLFIYHQHICLLHQTQWNRLDITDLETRVLLTDREIICRELPELNEYGNPKMEQINYVDYFHGRISFSPDYQYFVDAGWDWQPDAVPYVYKVEDFLKEYENARIKLYVKGKFLFGAEWDQYVVWFDENTFAFDFNPNEDLLNEADIKQVPKLHRYFFLTFSMLDEKEHHLEAQTVEKFPLFISIKPFDDLNEDGKVLQSQDYLPNLYYDRQLNLLLSIDNNHIVAWNKLTRKTYNFVYDKEKVNADNCLYSKEHHAIYSSPNAYGIYSYIKLKDIIARFEEN